MLGLDHIQLAAPAGAEPAAVAWAPPEEIPDLRRFHTVDPWGNRIELLAEMGA